MLEALPPHKEEIELSLVFAVFTALTLNPLHAGFTCGDNSGNLCCEPGTFPCYEGNPQTGYCCPGDDHTVCGVAPDGSGICSASLSVKHLLRKELQPEVVTRPPRTAVPQAKNP